MEPDDQISDEEIRARAHDIWDRHHRPEGHDLQFWFMAERELKAERRSIQERYGEAPLTDRPSNMADEADTKAKHSTA